MRKSATQAAALLAVISMTRMVPAALAQEAAGIGGEPNAAAAAAQPQPDAIPVEPATPEAAGPVAAVPEGPAQLDEIVVTATKREQSIRDIPASISAFSGAQLEDSGRLNLNDYITESPGVVAAQAAPGFTRLTFRGISTDTNPYAGNAQPVGIFIGDTPFTDPYIANIVPDLSAFDLADVEVLKGPQGTLFGGAALSGAVRYQLREPEMDTWQAFGFSQYAHPDGGSNAFTHGIAVNVPWTDHDVAARLNYVHRGYPGTVDNLRSGKKDADRSSGDQFRGQLLWEPEGWKLKFTHVDQDFSGKDLLLEVENQDERESNRAILPEASKNKFGMNSFEVDYDFDSLRAVSLTSWVKRDASFDQDTTAILAGTPPAGYPEDLGILTEVTDNSKNVSQEFRLQSTGEGPFTWLAGGYYFDYEMFFEILIDTPLNQDLFGRDGLIGSNPLLSAVFAGQGNQTSLLDGVSEAKSKELALFTDMSYVLWDRLTLSAGARFYKTRVHGGFVGTGVLIAGNENDGLQTNTVSTLKENGINPKFSATYQFTDDISVYATVAKGFRFGGIQDLPSTDANGVPAVYKSDTLWNHEIGLRTDWLDNTLRADLTAFYIRYKNPIITQQTQGIPINYNTNVSAAVSHGFEGNLLWNTPLRGLTWSAAAGYTDAHITKEFTASGGEVVEPGSRMPGSAKFQYSTSLSYLAAWERFTIGPTVGYNYVGKGYSNITHDLDINGFGTLNCGLVLATDGLFGNPKFAINVANVLNDTHVTGGGVSTTLITQQAYPVYLLNPPRTITARLSLEF